MEEADRVMLIELLEKAISECSNLDTLELVYQILITDTTQ